CVPLRPEEVELPEWKVRHEWPTVVKVSAAGLVAGRQGPGDHCSLAAAGIDDLPPKVLVLKQEVPAPAILDVPVEGLGLVFRFGAAGGLAAILRHQCLRSAIEELALAHAAAFAGQMRRYAIRPTPQASASWSVLTFHPTDQQPAMTSALSAS